MTSTTEKYTIYGVGTILVDKTMGKDEKEFILNTIKDFWELYDKDKEEFWCQFYDRMVHQSMGCESQKEQKKFADAVILALEGDGAIESPFDRTIDDADEFNEHCEQCINKLSDVPLTEEEYDKHIDRECGYDCNGDWFCMECRVCGGFASDKPIDDERQTLTLKLPTMKILKNQDEFTDADSVFTAEERDEFIKENMEEFIEEAQEAFDDLFWQKFSEEIRNVVEHKLKK